MKENLRKQGNRGQAALPIWMDFMKVAIADKKDEQFPEPPPEVLAGRKDKAESVAAKNFDGETH